MAPPSRLFAVVAAAALLAGCGGGPGPNPATSAECGPEERPAEQSGGHLLPGQDPPVAYSSVPPTSGWHAAGSVPIRVYAPSKPLTEPAQVTVLELGGVVLSWNGLDDEGRMLLETFAREEPGKVAVTPYERLEDGEVAMSAWGVLRRCDGVNLTAIREFVRAHHGGGPEH